MKIIVALVLLSLAQTSFAGPAERVHEKSLIEATELANGGSREAVHDLCYRHIYGKNSTQSFQKALQWCSYGAALGIDSSQVLLAELYYEGKGTDRSLERAFYWYSQAADQGHEHALLMLYYMYRDGVGVTQNAEIGRAFLQRAVDAGYQPAIEAMRPRAPVKR